MMFKRDTNQWVSSQDATKKSDIIMEGNPVRSIETILGLGLIVSGLFFTIRGAWASGGEDYLKAESKSLASIGCLDMTDEEIKAIKF